MSNLNENDYSILLQSVHHSDFTVNDFKIFYDKCKPINICKLTYPKTGDSIVHICARLGRTDLLDFIINNCGTNYVNLKDNDDKTPLHEAAQFGKYETAKLLIKFGAGINAIKRSDWTPLMLACTRTGQDAFEIVKILIDNGAILNLKNKDGWTVLHLACREGDIKIVQLLIDEIICSNRSNLFIKTKNGRTTLHIASLHGHYDIVVKLLEYINPNEKDNSGNNALHEGTFSNNKQIIYCLVSSGCNILSVNNVGFNCLHLAASEGLVDLLKYLTSNFIIDINAMSYSGFTPLHCAARKKQKTAIEALITMGADESIKDVHGRLANEYLDL